MSLPVSDNDFTEDGRTSLQDLEMYGVSATATQSGLRNEQAEPSEAKQEIGKTAETGPTIAPELEKTARKNNYSTLDNRKCSQEDTSPGVHQHCLGVSVTDTPTINLPLAARSDPITKSASTSHIPTDPGPLSSQPLLPDMTHQNGNGHVSSASAIKEPEVAEAPLADPDGIEEEDSQLEIQSIMEQFDEHTSAADSSTESAFLLQHPPRTSSLDDRLQQKPMLEDHLSEAQFSEPTSRFPHMETTQKHEHDTDPTAPAKRSSYASLTRPNSQLFGSPLSPKSSISLHKALPPAPDPEPDLPFDFHRFLDQLRHRTADPVAKFLRSFLVEFGKKQWMVHEQVKIICDFQLFIANKMGQCEIWRDVSDAEFDNAKEGMEKLVMNRLYTQTFSPAIPPPIQMINSKSRSKVPEKPNLHGRRGQHQEDMERDEILAQKVRIYGWVNEEHLDIPAVGERGRRFLNLARQGNA